jgi:uncharacterized membrane protein YvlD (DUF360 family)
MHVRHYHAPQSMLTLGMFSFVITAFMGCVWWACRDEGI